MTDAQADAITLIRSFPSDESSIDKSFSHLILDSLRDYEETDSVSDLIGSMAGVGHELARLWSVEKGVTLDEAFDELTAALIQAQIDYDATDDQAE